MQRGAPSGGQQEQRRTPAPYACARGSSKAARVAAVKRGLRRLHWARRYATSCILRVRGEMRKEPPGRDVEDVGRRSSLLFCEHVCTPR